MYDPGLPPYTFSGALAFYMKRSKVSEKYLSDLTGISERTLSRMRTDLSYMPSTEYVIAICIALQLYPFESYFLIELSGRKLRKDRHLDCIYHMLLNVEDSLSVANCNDFLIRHNLPSLTNLRHPNLASTN